MSENTTTSTTSETGAAQPTADPSETTTSQTTEATTDTGGESIDWKAEARKWETRSKTNAEKAKANADAAARLSKLEDANKSETQKLLERAEAAEKKATQYEGQLRSTTIRQAVIEAAAGAHALDAETVYLHLQARGGIDVDDNGQATGVDEAVKQLVKDKPHLFSVSTAGSRDAVGGTVPAPSAGDPLARALKSSLGIS